MKSFERDIDSATEDLDLRNALALSKDLGFTSLMLAVEYHELYSAYCKYEFTIT